MPKRILSEKNLSVDEVKEILEKTDEEDLSPFQKRAFEYVRKFSKMDKGKHGKVLSKLLKLGDVTGEEAVQILNLMPKSREELKTIFYHRKAIIMTEFLDSILETLWGEVPKEE